MNMELAALNALEQRIAQASRKDEAIIFATVTNLVDVSGEIAKLCAAQAFADAAIRIHRALLPANGFHLGETIARKGLASTWRRGEAQMLPFEAATPGLALLCATAHHTARQIQRDRRAQCGVCGGLGWTVTRKGGKRVCRHGAMI
ncbi:MAG TPA: hypothetical protein VN154_13425 [Rhizomicrobium sp.]|nr:hypothetical protein [Rhizomicrobium sp.]